MPSRSLSSRMTVEDLLHDERREAERRLVEEEQARPAHQRAGDGEHLLLAARQGAAALVQALLEARKDRADALEVLARNGRTPLTEAPICRFS